jgi:hypothetical protein
MTQQALTTRQDQTLSTAGLTARDVFDSKLHPEKPLRTHRHQLDNIPDM